MKKTPILTFIIKLALVLIGTSTSAQQVQDSANYKQKYGLRLGIDLSKPLRTLFDEDYSGFEVIGDYRLTENFYAAAELGNEKIGATEAYISTTSSGSYLKIGADYNAYQNWLDMQNMIFVGMRLGVASFSQTLEKYIVYSTSSYFEPDVREIHSKSSGLNASWIELMAGLKVEIFNNLFLSVNVQLKRSLTQKTPTSYDNLAIPGFNRTYDDSSIGVGYGYSISYLIPLYKKDKKQSAQEE